MDAHGVIAREYLIPSTHLITDDGVVEFRAVASF
jgi:hypothetical protein